MANTIRVDELMRRCRVALDLNAATQPLLEVGDVDTLSLEEIIRSKLPAAVRWAHYGAAVEAVADAAVDMDCESVWWTDQGSGWVLLPGDFLRLVSFQMDDWDRPAHELIGPFHPDYVLTKSRYRALRGTPENPRCAMGLRPEGRTLEFHTCDTEDAEVVAALYVAEPRVIDGALTVAERCVDAVVYRACSLAATAMGATEQATLMSALAEEHLKEAAV